MLVFSEKLSQLRIRHQRHHAILCGLDNKSLLIADGFLKKNRAVVFITNNSRNELIGQAKNIGAHVLIGNSIDHSCLFSAGILKATHLLVLTNTDNINIQTIKQAYLLRKHKANLPKLSCIVHINCHATMAALYDQEIFYRYHDTFSANLINYEKISARYLLLNYGPENEIPTFLENIDDSTIMIIGDGKFIDEIILRLACIGHYGQQDRLNIHIISENSIEELNNLKTRHPILNELINLRATNLNLNLHNINQCKSALDNIAPSIIYMHLATVKHSLVWPQLLNNLSLKCPVISTFSEDILISSLELENSKMKSIPIYINSCNFNEIIHAKQDALAISIHNNYVKTQISAGDSPDMNPSLIEWDLLPGTLKDANRNQADHLKIKRSILNTMINGNGAALDLSSDCIEKLAIIEHKRWCAEKLLSGWSYTTGDKDVALRLSPCLTSWDNLPEAEKDKDRQSLHQLPELINIMSSSYH